MHIHKKAYNIGVAPQYYSCAKNTFILNVFFSI